MNQMNPKILVAAIAVGAAVAGFGASMLMPRSAVKFSGTVEIDPRSNNNPPVAIQPEQAPPPPLKPAPDQGLPPIQQLPPVEPRPIPKNYVRASKPLTTTDGVEMQPVDVPITKITQTAEENLQEALGELVNRKSVNKNKPRDKTSSAIPTGTKLLSLKVKKGDIHVDLSEEFEKSDSTNNLQTRLAEVIYTATNLDHNAKVWLMVNGRELKNLGDLDIRQPITRTTLSEDFPSIKGAH
jgi:Sporulation and spore germination